MGLALKTLYGWNSCGCCLLPLEELPGAFGGSGSVVGGACGVGCDCVAAGRMCMPLPFETAFAACGMLCPPVVCKDCRRFGNPLKVKGT